MDAAARITLLATGLASLLLTGPVPAAPLPSVTIVQNFTGATRAEDIFTPPSPSGAVGPAEVVVVTSGSFRVYRKSDGLELVSKTLAAFWADAGATVESDAFDPRVLYDPATGRWIAASSSDALTSTSSILLAASATSDPAGSWTAVEFDADPTDASWVQDLVLGVDGQAVYAGVISFDNTTFFFLASRVLVVPKADLLAGIGGTGTFVDFSSQLGHNPVFDLDGGAFPGTSVSTLTSPSLSPGLTTFGGTLAAPTAGTTSSLGLPFSVPPFAEQPSPPVVPIFAGDQLTRGGAILRDGSVWGVQTIASGGRTALRWFEADAASATLLQSGIVSDPARDLYHGSITITPDDRVMIAFNRSGPSDFVSVFVVAGDASDASLMLTDPILVQAGEAIYTGAGFPPQRIGDYSTVAQDPSDSERVWSFVPFANTSGEWSLRITEINLPEPGLQSGLMAGILLLSALRRSSRCRGMLRP